MHCTVPQPIVLCGNLMLDDDITPSDGSHTKQPIFKFSDYMNLNNEAINNLVIPDTVYLEFDDLKGRFNEHMNAKYSCLHLNIQSLPSKFETLQELLAVLKENDIHIDFIMLCETFLNNDITHFYNLPGYNLVSLNRVKLSRGGVALYISTDFNYKLRTDLGINVEGQFESIFIEAKSKKYNETVIVGEVYRIPNTNINESLSRYATIIDRLSKYSNVYIGTDQNIDYLKINSHKGTEDLLECFLSGGFVPLINKPTRITHRSATLIDNIYTKPKQAQQITSYIMSYDISDHLPLLTLAGNTKPTKTEALTFSYKPLNTDTINAINNDLKSYDWNVLANQNDINRSYDLFSSTVKGIIDRRAPTITRTISPSKVIREPWFSKGLQKSSKQLHKLYYKALGKKPDETPQIKYKHYRNIFNKLKRNAKHLYYQQEFNKHKNCVKKTWQLLNSVINKTSNKFSILDFFSSEPKTVAQNFCTYFTDAGPNLAKNIPQGKHLPEHYMKGSFLDSFYLTPTDENEVIKAMTSLKTSSSSGHDEISSTVAKKLTSGLAIPLTLLINMSIEQGKVPSALKIAKVIPIYKKDDKSEYGNYRPISLLPTFSKIYEKIMHKRLYSYVINKCIIYESQYGFRQGHSTTHAVSELVENVIKGFDNKETTLAIFLHLSKAFDTIDHDILLKKLKFYGVRGQALDWFTSYLLDRQQYVSIDGHDSNKSHIKCGVPQGSVLGPLLFIIYTNDLPSNLSYCKSILFADDTNLFKTSKSLDDLFNQANLDLKIITDWFQTNQLSLNISKTHYILFTLGKQNTSGYHIQLAGKRIEQKRYVKFLGLTVDEHLSWKYHADCVIKRLTSALFALRRTKKLVSRDNLLTLYYSLFYSHINYGLMLWGSASKTILNKIIVMQKKAIRLITGSHYNAHTTPLFTELKVLKFEDMYDLQLSKFIFCLYQNNIPKPLQSFFSLNSDTHNYSTRNQNNPSLPLHKCNVTAMSIFSKSYKLWYCMDLYLKSSVSLSVFSYRYKKIILHKYATM